MLTDGFGRKIDYLRISLTDKCNLRCRYCVPQCGVDKLEHGKILSFEEIVRIADVLVSLGITKIRFTGGEPLVRRDAVSVIRDVASLRPDLSVGLTTNGILLKEYLPDLYKAGVRNINISIDTLNEKRYESICGINSLTRVLDSASSCIDMGMRLKINTVLVKGLNDCDIPDLASLAADEDIVVRFIELMPVGCGALFEGIPNDQVKDILTAVYGKAVPVERKEHQGPAEYVKFKGFCGEVGFISPMSHAFCSRCDRIRLTCEGKLKLCLASPDCLDLRELLRSGASDEDLAEAIRGALMRKPRDHGYRFTDHRNMIGIGG